MSSSGSVRSSGRGPGWIPELEGLRAVLAWTVVATHLLICSGWFGPMFFRGRLLNQLSEAAVDVFILISGFAITRLLVVEAESYPIYLARRALRLFPAYWVALACGILLNGWLAANFRHLPPSPEADAYALICEIGAARPWVDGILHFFLLQGLPPTSVLPAEPYTFLGVAWSLSLEWQFYCVAPFALWWARRNKIGGFILALLAGCGALFSPKLMGEFSNAFLPVKAAFFFVGGLSYVAVVENEYPRRALRWLFVSTLLLLLVWLIGTGKVIEALLPAIVWFLVLAAVRLHWLGLIRAGLRLRPMQFLGRVSYSTYLFHVPVIIVIQTVLWHWAPPANPRQLLFYTAMSAVPATLLVSWLAWWLVERPPQRWGKRLKR